MEEEISRVENRIGEAIQRIKSSEHIKQWETLHSEIKRVETDYSEFEKTGNRLISALQQGNTAEMHEIDEDIFTDLTPPGSDLSLILTAHQPFKRVYSLNFCTLPIRIVFYFDYILFGIIILHHENYFHLSEIRQIS